MANKAFVCIGNVSADGGTLGAVAHASYQLLDPSDYNGGGSDRIVSAHFDYGDDFEAIHRALADAVRSLNSDPSIIVLFTDSPGRF